MKNELYHHGILGQKWGVKNGPPYPLKGGAYSSSEKEAIYKERKKKYSIYNKKHFDKVLTPDETTLTTFNYNPNRTKNGDMFYAIHTPRDVHQYNVNFNAPLNRELYDEKNNFIGSGNYLKWRINNGIKTDLKIASEDTAANAFRKLYSKDRDFYNFVTDEKRMQSHFPERRYVFLGYREARSVLNKMRSDKNYVPTAKDLQVIYRMFNYVIPLDGGGDKRRAHDVAIQRAKFFRELKKLGYGAVLDTNDAIYGGYKAQSPIIVFDMQNVIPKDVYMTTVNSKIYSELAYLGRRAINM